VERVVGGEIELREQRIGDVDLEALGGEDEQDDEDGGANDGEDSNGDFGNEAGAVAVVGTIQVGLFFFHETSQRKHALILANNSRPIL
jgi:hypothetical protein